MGISAVTTRVVTYECTRCKNKVERREDPAAAGDPPGGWRLLRLFHWNGTKVFNADLCDRCAIAACQFLRGEQTAPVGA